MKKVNSIMTQEQKELLLKDLCGRLPYGVKVQSYRYGEDDVETIETLHEIDSNGYMSTLECETLVPISKPYLFPLSTMTDEQYNDFFTYFHDAEMKEIKTSGDYLKAAYLVENAKHDWLNKNHFDYRYLIPMGLANNAAGLNIY